MRNLLRRLGCLLAFFLWLAVMTLPCFVVGLAMRGELAWERGPQTRDRLYLIQERDGTGLGYSSTRPTASATAEVTCARTDEYLWLWRPRGRFDQFSSCSCVVLSEDGGQTPAGECGP